MAILFFRRLPELEDPTSSGMLTALGELRGNPPSAAAWLALHPAGSAPPPSNPLADGSEARAAQAATPALLALLSESGALADTFYKNQRSELRAAIGELRNDIADMQKIADEELSIEESSRGLDIEAYGTLIKAEQEQLGDLYAQVLTSAEYKEGEVESLQDQYEALVERLRTWKLPPTPRKAQGTSWRLPTPTPTR
jgi:NTP pyrophosphatase (non-canonical NTP hydrolase)